MRNPVQSLCHGSQWSNPMRLRFIKVEISYDYIDHPLSAEALEKGKQATIVLPIDRVEMDRKTKTLCMVLDNQLEQIGKIRLQG
jgi:hypothetical protein